MADLAADKSAAADIKPEVREVFKSYPEAIRAELFKLRELIFETAASIDGVGEITETLKWGEPAYLPAKSRTGSTIRIAWKAKAPSQYAMYFICNTNLVDTFRTLFPELNFEGNRAIVLEQGEAPPVEALARCIELALTYHLRRT